VCVLERDLSKHSTRSKASTESSWTRLVGVWVSNEGRSTVGGRKNTTTQQQGDGYQWAREW
jgi:hypothetical protein